MTMGLWNVSTAHALVTLGTVAASSLTVPRATPVSIKATVVIPIMVSYVAATMV